MINSNLRTQLQAKITAATSATSTSDLMLMRVAAQGLNLDETNLDTLLTPKLNAISVANPATSFVEAWRSLGFDGNVLYTVPFDTQPGDLLFVDVLGSVTKQRYPSQASVSNVFDPNAVDLKSPTNTLNRVRVGAMLRGSATGGNDAAAAITLSDGNILHLQFGYDYASTIVGVGVSVLSGANLSVLSTAFADPTIGTDHMTSSSAVLGIWEQSPNVFRLWISTPEAGTGSCRKIGYYVLTYNDASKVVTFSNGASVLVGTAGVDWAYPNSRSRIQMQNQRYVIVSLGTSAHYTLDLASSTLTNHTTLASQNANFSQTDYFSAGNEHTRVTYGANVRLVQASSASLKTLPANLTSDGCFSNANDVVPVGPLQWLCYNATTGVCKVVQFNSTHSTCNIWTVGTLAKKITSMLQVTRSGDVIRVYGGGYGFSFKWTSGTAPDLIQLDQPFKNSRPLVFDRDGTLAPSTEYILYTHLRVRDDATKQEVKAFLKVPASEYDPAGSTHFGTVIEGNAANQPIEVALKDNTIKTYKVTTSLDCVTHQGLLTRVEDAPTHQYAESVTAGETALMASLRSQLYSDIVSSSGGGVYAYGSDCIGYCKATGYSSHIGNVTVFNGNGRLTRNLIGAGSTIPASAVARSRSNFLMSIAASISEFYGESKR